MNRGLGHTLALDENYRLLSDEKITREFIDRIRDSSNQTARLEGITTEERLQGLGADHSDLIADIFNKKYRKRHVEVDHRIGLEDFLGETSLANIRVRGISEEESRRMEMEFSEDEMDKAVKRLKLTSALGPDGVLLAIIRQFWSVLRNPVLQTLNHYIRGDLLLPDYLTGKLKLIPKKGSPASIKNWRPITVLNSRYKLLSIAYTNRLKMVIS